MKSRPGGASAAVAVAALAWLAFAATAQAADPAFPIGSFIGLVPPPGMVPSKTFRGFEDAAADAAISVTAEPIAELSAIQGSIATEALKKEDIAVQKREDIQLSFGTGTLLTAIQEVDKKRYRKWLVVAPAKEVVALVNVQIFEHEKEYPDAVVRAALATLALRDKVPDAENLSLLPFKIGDLAGFHIRNVLPGRAILLADGADGTTLDPLATHMFIAAFPGGPQEANDRAEFARVTFSDIVGIKDVHITMAEPLRIGSQPGFQMVAQAKDGRTDADVMVAQWLLFGSGGFLQMIGIAKNDQWSEALARLRTVRDSIDTR